MPPRRNASITLQNVGFAAVVPLLLAALAAWYPVAAAADGARYGLESIGSYSMRGDTLGIIVDDADADRVEITAYWKRLTADEVDGAYGPSLLSDDGLNADSDVRFIPEFTESGVYEVSLYWPPLHDANKQLASNVRVTVRHAEGEKRFTIDQRASAGAWRLLGRFPFEPGKPGHVQFITDEANGVVVADAVRFQLVAPEATS